MRDLRLHGVRHAADEARQADADRHGVAVGGEQTGGEVERLVDDHVVGGAHQVGLHLLGHGDDAVAHDLGDDRIDLVSVHCHCALPYAPTAITKLPNASTSTTEPGSTTVVDACSSISAGPSMRLPASRWARAKVGVAVKAPSKKTSRLPV